MMKWMNLTSVKKKLLLFVGAFAICPCPVHGTILGLTLVGASCVLGRKQQKCVDKHCNEC